MSIEKSIQMKNYCDALQGGIIQEEINEEINDEMSYDNKTMSMGKTNHKRKDYEISIRVKDMN